MDKKKLQTEYRLSLFQKVYALIKAVMDFICALLALIILSPLFLIVAIAIKIDSKGPVFFVQKRIGKNGKTFNCIKFRSMSQDANHEIAGYIYKEADSYITRVGRIIRKLSIDELPQIFCILTFKMSWIGYRPAQANELTLNEPREEYGVYQITPGISGWAQVNGRDLLAAHPQKKAEYDAYYLHNFSFWLDIKIFFMTIVKVFSCSDVSEGEKNASENTRDVVIDEAAFTEDSSKVS